MDGDLRYGCPPAVDVEQGLLAVAVGVAAHGSIDEGRVDAVDEVIAG